VSSGIDAVRAALIANAPLIALVPAARIMAGDLPQGTTLPALSLTSISKVDRNIPNPGSYRHVTERVQVMIHAANYPSQKAVEAAVRRAAADKLDVSVSGLVNITIHTDGAGPDIMNEEASIHLGTQDFRTTYSELR
jgi:hypothetical protein